MEQAQELFKLKNGQLILSEDLSDKMFYIKSKSPEIKPTNSTGYTWDESGMAELFSEVYKSSARYCAEAKSWYAYDNGAWHKDIGSLITAEKIKEFSRLMQLYCGEIADDDKRKSYSKFIIRMGDRRFRDRLMKDAASVYPISATQFDNNPNLINCLNGTYDLDKMEFREHSWRDYLTMQTNFSYTLQDNVEYPRFEEFIKEVTSNDLEKARYLQTALGYSILGSSKEECMFILHGKTTRNGKSTLLGAINYILGDYATVSPVSIICKSVQAKNGDNPTPTLAALKSKRFVTMSESDKYGSLDAETIKQLTGGEAITARYLHENMITFLPQFTLWLSCNDLPAIDDNSLFNSDRIIVIEFNRHFKKDERDKTLKDEFKTEKAMRGIFHWLITGYFMYKKHGLILPDNMKKVVNAYEKDNDLMLQFLEDRCESVDDEKVQINAKSLYSNYKTWARSNGYNSITFKKFIANLNQHSEWFIGQQKSNRTLYFSGLKIKI